MFTIMAMFITAISVLYGILFVRLLFKGNAIERRRGSIIVMVPTVLGALVGLLFGSAWVGAQLGFSLGTAFLHYLTYARLGPM